MCHSFEKGGPAIVGPDLYGVVGRKIASVEGFNYTPALKAHEGDWTYQKLDVWLKNPQAFAPGTMMAFPGVADDKKRAAIIAFLRSNSDNPVPLPEAAAAKPEEKATETPAAPEEAAPAAEVAPPAASPPSAETPAAPMEAAPSAETPAPSAETPAAPAEEAPPAASEDAGASRGGAPSAPAGEPPSANRRSRRSGRRSRRGCRADRSRPRRPSR